MQVALGHVISFHYTLRAEAGAVLDSSSGKPPFTYLHGYQGLSIVGLEEELTGHEVGEEIVLTLPPSQMFGDYDPQKIQTVPHELFPSSVTLTAGARYATTTPEGKELSFGVLAIQPEVVIVDFNHPLAGQRALLSVTVESVRPASPEEFRRGQPL
jgi:FKBP-type peptidyl-prolyl cis-trans isomerase SlyD